MQYTWLLLPTKRIFVTIAIKWNKFFLCWKGKALYKHLFALYRLQPEKFKQNSTFPLGKITADAHRKGAWGHSNESLPITAVRNTGEWRFSKLRLIKMFRRSTMTNERLTNLAMISIESETAKIWDMFELTNTNRPTFAFLKTWKSHFPSLKYRKCLSLSALYVVLMLLKMLL